MENNIKNHQPVKILAFSGSPRERGNSRQLLEHFLRGAQEAGAETETFRAQDLNLEHCSGCLRCNLIKRCAQRKDDWPGLAEKILAADVITVASPVYFHHLTAPMKKVIDRFRCFLQVRITETGLIHTPHHSWSKHWVLLLALGSSSSEDTKPIIDLFNFMTTTLGPQNHLHSITGTRLAVPGQLTMDEAQLSTLYSKLQLPEHLAPTDRQRNLQLMDRCRTLGRELATRPA